MRRVGLAVVLALLAHAPAWATPVFVQSKTGANNTALTSNTTSGNFVWVWVYWNTTDTLNSVTGCNGSTFTLLDNPTAMFGGGAQVSVAQAYAENISGGSCTVTANFSATPGFIRIAIHEVSGIATSSSIDGHTAQCQLSPGSGTDAVSSGSITTLSSGDYIVSGTGDNGAHNDTATAGTGFSARETEGGFIGYGTEDEVQSSAGSIAGTFTVSNGNSVAQCTTVAAFKAAAVAPPPTGNCVVGLRVGLCP